MTNTKGLLGHTKDNAEALGVHDFTAQGKRRSGHARVLCLCLSALTTACGALENDGDAGSVDDGVEELTITVEADKSRILQEEEALDKQREQVHSDRDRLAKERRALTQKLASVSAKDKTTRQKLEAEQKRIDADDKRVRQRARRFEDERTKLDRQKSALLNTISQIAAKGGGNQSIQQREAGMARREKQLARREADLAEREAKLAEREGRVSKTLAELNQAMGGLGGTSRTIVVNQPAAGENVTRGGAQRARNALRSRMNSKGILLDDLPPMGRKFFTQGNQSLGERNYRDAAGAFARVQAIVDSMRIDGAFVTAKSLRINKVVSGRQLSEKNKRRVQELLSSANDAVTAGRFDKANRRINQISGLLGAR